MKKITCTLLFLNFVISLSAQEVVSVQGDSYSISTLSIDFTIGEVVVHQGNNGSVNLSEGFHQSSWDLLGVDDYIPEYEVAIFPNPASETIHVKTTLFNDVTYSLIDNTGKMILTDKLTQELTSIQVKYLATGNYFLNLKSNGTTLKTFKLVKSN